MSSLKSEIFATPVAAKLAVLPVVFLLIHPYRMNCKEGRALELMVVTQTAPGYLSGYTKIVRLLPRYVVVNNLPYPVRIWQHNSIFRPASSVDVLKSSGRE